MAEAIEAAGEAAPQDENKQGAAGATNETADQAGATPREPEIKPAPPSLAGAIREAREARATARREVQAKTDLQTRLDAALAKVKALEADDPLADPAGWAKARGYGPKEQAILGQSLLYDLVPDKAPPDMRVRLMEIRQARKEREAEERRVADERGRAEAATRAQINSYRGAVEQAARSFESGSHPESEAWFGDDRKAWAESLFATANNLAEQARKQGKQPDLSPANVARVLEAEIGRRMTDRDTRRAGAKNRSEAKAEAQKEAAPGPTSTKGLNSGGPPGKAVDDKDRVARAVAAGWARK